MLKIYNTLTGQKETFEPLVPKTVRMYACGVTVYDYSHLGHARSALVFDVIRNYLQFSGYAVKYVRNFTDVDDKIINRASEKKKTSEEIAQEYLLAYQEDMKRLGVVPADVEPKATEHIPDIIRLIQTLVAKGHAYRLDGDVYFEVGTYPAYGRLSKRKGEDLLAGARVEVDERKRNPMDFALWKSSKPGEPAWNSPWGPGRPGWHIECSAMARHYLGETFDIHGGGQDLIFPHHENEIAQSCAATGKELARYWVHNGFVQVNLEKMSKSLGNFFTIRQIFVIAGLWGWSNQVTVEALRYFLLATHYRSPLDFSDQSLQEAKNALNGFYDLFYRLKEPSGKQGKGDKSLSQAVERLKVAFREAMDDDFNTTVAIAELQKFRGKVNKLLEIGLSREACKEAREAFESRGGVLRLFQLKDWQFNPVRKVSGTEDLKAGLGEERAQVSSVITDIDIQAKVDERNKARRRKDFRRADEIRSELLKEGITIEDRPDGTSRWKR